MSTINLNQQFAHKVQQQWKTLKKAFWDLNLGKTGHIIKDELAYYLTHWGFKYSEEGLNCLFNSIDVDQDGKISYEDFQNSIGKEISPPEFLYF